MNDHSENGNYHYAGLWYRFLALLADFVILSIPFFIVTRIVKGVWLMGTGDHRWVYGWFVNDPLCIIFLVIIILYFILLEGLAGATLGKLAVGIRVISLDGGKPGLKRSLIRSLLRAVDSLPAFNIVGMVLIIKSPERARFGDRVAGTRVVHLRRL